VRAFVGRLAPAAYGHTPMRLAVMRTPWCARHARLRACPIPASHGAGETREPAGSAPGVAPWDCFMCTRVMALLSFGPLTLELTAAPFGREHRKRRE
jgi:hypothetical protein